MSQQDGWIAAVAVGSEAAMNWLEKQRQLQQSLRNIAGTAA